MHYFKILDFYISLIDCNVKLLNQFRSKFTSANNFCKHRKLLFLQTINLSKWDLFGPLVGRIHFCSFLKYCDSLLFRTHNIWVFMQGIIFCEYMTLIDLSLLFYTMLFHEQLMSVLKSVLDIWNYWNSVLKIWKSHKRLSFLVWKLPI